ncbi:hypothetical protein ABIB40_002543 [Pedobacter sp. UYP30]|uniref:hypothetical protein n=1 Tax=Pedobacter sp. UYP30 TaxID=1756400 RepID=UPI003395A180
METINRTNKFSTTIKSSKDIFGADLKSITISANGKERTIILKKSNDIFGNRIISLLNDKGQLIASVKKSNDIFGAEITELKDAKDKLLFSIKKMRIYLMMKK